MNRLGIFLFYDNDGRLSPHMRLSLAAFSDYLRTIVVVVNGFIDDESRDWIAQRGFTLIVRDNYGYDVWGYRHGLFSVGFSSLKLYDEVVLFNYTFFAPTSNLGAMFNHFENRLDVDAWGITEYNDGSKRFLQSYFLCTRRRLHCSDEYYSYWSTMPDIRSIDDSIHFHEFRFSNHFENLGYKTEAYISNEPGWTGNTTLIDVPGLIKAGAPIIKYRAFNFDADIIERRGGLKALSNFRAIEQQTNYPIDNIWDYIISQTHTDKLIENLELGCVTYQSSMAFEGHEKTSNYLVACIDSLRGLGDLCSIADAFDPSHVLVSTHNKHVFDVALEHNFVCKELCNNDITTMPILHWSRELQDTDTKSGSVIFSLTDFTGEKPLYHFNDSLIEHYWSPIARDITTISCVEQYFHQNKYVGLFFAPTTSVVGRTTYFRQLQATQSSWDSEKLPKPLTTLKTCNYWPWRGNFAIRTELTKSDLFWSLLATTAAARHIDADDRDASVEVFLPEICRKLGYAAGLAIWSQHAVKLAVKNAFEERRNRTELDKQVSRLKKLSSDYSNNAAGNRSSQNEQTAPSMEPLAPSSSIAVTEITQSRYPYVRVTSDGAFLAHNRNSADPLDIRLNVARIVAGR